MHLVINSLEGRHTHTDEPFQETRHPLTTGHQHTPGLKIIGMATHIEFLVIVMSQAGLGYHCCDTRPRPKPEVEC